MRRELRIDVLVDERLRAAHLQIRLPRETARGGGKLVERRAVDELHRISQPDAQRDGQHGDQRAAPMTAPLRAEQPAREHVETAARDGDSVHRASVAACNAPSLRITMRSANAAAASECVTITVAAC